MSLQRPQRSRPVSSSHRNPAPGKEIEGEKRRAENQCHLARRSGYGAPRSKIGVQGCITPLKLRGHEPILIRVLGPFGGPKERVIKGVGRGGRDVSTDM